MTSGGLSIIGRTVPFKGGFVKLVIAVVQDTDADGAVEALITAGFSATRIASTGGFLKAGNADAFGWCGG